MKTNTVGTHLKRLSKALLMTTYNIVYFGKISGHLYYLKFWCFPFSSSDINNDAEFTNLPLSTTLEVMENTPVDTPLYTILYRDRDIADTKIMTVTYSDDRLSRLFNLDPSSKFTYY